MASTALDSKNRSWTRTMLFASICLAILMTLAGITLIASGDQGRALAGIVCFLVSVPFWFNAGQERASLSLGYYKRYDQK